MITAEVPRPTKTTGDMTNYQTGAVRDTGGKGRMDLLPMCALLRISKHMENALSHYPERNWEKGMPMHCMIDSALRHLAKYVDGMYDEDHLCAAAANLLMALWTEEKMPSMQDIPTRTNNTAPEQLSMDESLNFRECDSYRVINGVPVCYGTKEAERCSCCGNECDCDFYPEKRKNHLG